MTEPIAIVGLSLKFPGGSDNEATFWDILRDRTNVATEWPSSRTKIDSFYHPDKSKLQVIHSREAHFLKNDPAEFDAPFFSITANEAMAMDPQQRMILEASYRALENAGIPVERVAGTDTAVYSATMSDDYGKMVMKDSENSPQYSATGLSPTIMANRVSWFFDFHGPSLHVDTACSGSLVALDLACKSLQNGDSSMALVAGSSLLLSPELSIALSNMNFLSPDSRCYSFDERANGYSRGEGVAVLAIKRLSDAIRDLDTIRAVIRGTGINQDGHTPGLTQPSMESQENLIRKVYQNAQLDFSMTRYVEAHGTGTALGDPIEMKALGRIFRSSRSRDDPLLVGSVKGNIGHLEGASGLAGIIKALLILEKGIIPPNANFERLNPNIDAEFLHVKVPVQCTPWPAAGLRRVSINSFGFGGTNGHVVLDDAYHFLQERHLVANHCTTPEPPMLSPFNTEVPYMNGHSRTASVVSAIISSHVVTNGVNGDHSHEINGFTPNGIHHDTELTNHYNSSEEPTFSRPRLLVWSAADENALRRMHTDYATYCSYQLPNTWDSIDRIAFTLSSHRSLMAWRSYALADSPSNLKDLEPLITKPTRSDHKQGLAFVFTGQGAQYVDMGIELLVFPTFRDTLQAIDDALQDLGCSWFIVDEIRNKHNIHRPEYSQPLCTALQIALVELLKSIGVVPAAVIGHSSGEIAAAYAAGALSLQSACRVAYHRGRLAGNLVALESSPGAMLSVNLPENAVPGYLRSLNHPGMEQGLSIACINSPSNVTLSGKEELIDALKKQLDVDGIFARTVRTGLAYHSSAMRPIALEYQDAIGSLMPDENGLSAIPMISSVTGQPVRASTLRTPEYWVDNMVNPVKFLHSMQRLLQGSTAAKMGMARLPTIRHLVEIGPHSALSRPSQDIIAEMALRRDIRYLSVLSRFKSSLSTALELAGELFTYGYPVNIDAVNRDLESTAPAFLTDTPEYPFDHSQRYWYEPRISSDFRLRDAAQNDLLGTPSIDYNPLEPRWRKFLSTESTSWIADHVVSDVAVYPGAGMLVMAMEAVKQVAQKGRQIAGFFIKEADFSRAMVVRSGLEGRVESNVHLRFLQRPFEKESTASEVRISVRYNDGGWAECCRTMIQVVYENRKTEVDGGFETRYATEKTLNDFESATKACQQRIDREDFYKYHANHGIRWGPSFQQLEDMYWDGFETAISQVQVSDTEFHRTSIVHPAVLDAMYQMTWIGPTRGLSQTIPTEIPRKIWDMWVSATGWSYNSTDRIRVMTQSRFKPGSRGLDASTYAVSANGTLLLSMARTQLAPAASDSALARAQKQLCYSIDWKPQLSLLDSQQLSELCRAHEIDRDEEILVHFVQQLTLAISATMRNTLEELEKTGRRPSSTHLQKYVEWMRYQLNRVPAGELAGVNHVDTLDSSEDLLQDLIQKLGSSVSGWQMMITVARNLSGILQGDIDPLAILFETNLAESFYGIAFKGVCDRRFETFMDLASHEKPELRILEVGAGTGMMTSHVISALQNLEREKGGARFAEYVYTDISPAFFEKAREKFVDVQDRLVFKTLDLERDVIEQGFEAESYDLVIAGNVIHATTSIQSSLENIRKALKPGGKLVMVEVTEPDRLYIPFGFGILRGWWLSTEKYRSWSPCITEEQWNSVLKTSGFSGNAMTLGDHQSDSCHFSSLIVSTVPMETRNSQNQEIAVVVKSNNHSQRQTDLARFLQEDLAYKAGYHVAVSSLSEAPSTVISQAEVVLFIPEIDGSILKDLSEADFTSLQTLSASAKRMIWVTSADIRSPSYPESGAASGLTRTLRSERANQQLTSLVLEGENHDLRKCSEDIVKVLAASSDQSSTEKEVEYVVRDGQIMTARIIEESAIESDFQSTMYPQSRQEQLDPNRPLTLSIGTPGSLDTLQFIEDPIPSRDLGPDEVEIDAKSWGMNFRDILVALGRLEEDTFGFEAAGYISRVGSNCTKFQPGDRVIMVNVGCMRMYPRCDQRLAIKLPDSISFEDAASAAGVGITAYHSLIKVARLQKGDRVLIHSGSGGTGQMAIRVAQMVGAEVFTTVGYDEKKKLLVDQLQVPEDHVLYSRDTSFAQAIKRMTNGHGVDVVLNSLSGDSLVASWECIAPYGRFIEIGKADIYANSTLPMSMFALNVSFAAVDFVHLSQTGQDTVHTVLTEFFDLLANGTILPPFPIQTYPLSKVEDAFRLMQSGKNSGRIVVTSQPADVVPTFGVAHRSWKFDSNATYLIAGGTGGLGRSAAKWMVSKGAKNLLLLSRSGSSSAAASKLMTQLRGQGVNVEAPSCDVASRESVQLVLQKYATSLPPIKGCLNASMVLQNALFEKMTHSQWDIAVRSKINTSWNLHTLLPNDLDFFIMLSSLSGIVGAIGQSNYGAGNTYQDALARYRTSHGQTALSMDLGLMGDIGIVAETEEYSRKRGLLVNMTEVEEQEYLNLLDIYCNPNLGVLPPEKSQILVGVMTPAKHQAQGTEVPDMLMRRLFSGFSTMNSLANHASSSDTVDAAAMFRRAGSVEERTEVVTALLAQKLARSLSIPAEDVNPNKPLFEYGVDSLIAVELRNWISKEFAADISVFDLMGGMKIAAVADFVATKANLGKGAGAR